MEPPDAVPTYLLQLLANSRRNGILEVPQYLDNICTKRALFLHRIFFINCVNEQCGKRTN